MADRSSGFPATSTVHDLATSTVPSAKGHTTEPVDFHETLAESHLSGSEYRPNLGTSFGNGGGSTHPPHPIPGPTAFGNPPPGGNPKPIHTPIPVNQHPPDRDPKPRIFRPRPPVAGPPGPPGAEGPPGAPGPAGAPGGGTQSAPELLFFGGNANPNADTQDSGNQQQAPAQPTNPLAIVAILAVIGVGVWFYMQHEKKARGGSTEKREEPKEKREEKSEEKKE